MKPLADLTLGKKIALLTTVGLIVAVGVFGYLGIRAANQATEAMLEDRMATAHVVSDYLDELLGHALDEMKRTKQALANNGNPQTQIDTLKAMFSHLEIPISAAYLLSKDGQIIWGQPENASEVHGNALYPYVQQALESGIPFVSGLTPMPLTNVPVVFLVSPVTGRNGQLEALLVAIDLARSSMGVFIEPIRLGQTGYVEIVDQNGIVVLRTRPGPELAQFERSDHSGRFAELIATGKPTRGLCHTCHEPIQKVERRDVLAFVPLSQAQWGVVIRQSEEEALAPVYELRRSLIFAAGILVVVVLLFVIVITKDVLGRVKMLTVASRRIAQGDLVSSIDTVRRDEIGLLGHSLEDMRIRLKASYEDLERRTKELSSLLAMSEILTSAVDLSSLDQTLGNALSKTLEIMNQKTGGILILNDEDKKLYYRAYFGLPKKYAQETYYHPGEGIAGMVAQTARPILIKDIRNISTRTFPHDDPIFAQGLKAIASVALRAKDKTLGVLVIASHRSWQVSPDDLRLLEGISRQIATALENVRLNQDIKQKDEMRGELLREIYSVQEEERRRISRELHDETSQVLASLTANLEAASEMLPANAHNKVKTLLKKAQTLSVNILDETHRLIYELRPILLDDLGLLPALRWLLDNSLRATGIEVDFRTIGRERRLSSPLETTVFRVTQETVSNIIRHAHARKAVLKLHFKKNTVRVYIKDDGTGFDVGEAISSKNRPRGLGLLGMKERVELFQGTFVIRSRQGGTEITIEIPTNHKEVNNG
ncbi:GAF domain-containing protein [Chloroflexota bacterium]